MFSAKYGRTQTGRLALRETRERGQRQRPEKTAKNRKPAPRRIGVGLLSYWPRSYFQLTLKKLQFLYFIGMRSFLVYLIRLISEKTLKKVFNPLCGGSAPVAPYGFLWGTVGPPNGPYMGVLGVPRAQK